MYFISYPIASVLRFSSYSFIIYCLLLIDDAPNSFMNKCLLLDQTSCLLRHVQSKIDRMIGLLDKNLPVGGTKSLQLYQI